MMANSDPLGPMLVEFSTMRERLVARLGSNAKAAAFLENQASFMWARSRRAGETTDDDDGLEPVAVGANKILANLAHKISASQ